MVLSKARVRHLGSAPCAMTLDGTWIFDWSWTPQLQGGILQRQGISKDRHIDVNWLWLQEQAAKRLVPLVKIPGEINTADLMTKHLSNAMILKHLQNLRLRHFSSGRADMAANLHALQPKTENKLCKFDRRLKSEKADSVNERIYTVRRGTPGLTHGRHAMGVGGRRD